MPSRRPVNDFHRYGQKSVGIVRENWGRVDPAVVRVGAQGSIELAQPVNLRPITAKPQ